MKNSNTKQVICKTKIGNVTKKKTHKEYADEVFSLVGEEYSVISEYENSVTKVRIKHNKCGHDWFVLPNSFTSTGSRCPKCAVSVRGKKTRMTQSEFERRVEEAHGSDYIVVGEYKRSKEKIEIKHLLCGTTYKVKPVVILNDRGCPVCNSSKGERDIKNFLDNNQLEYKMQYKIKECKNILPLPFDFAVLNNGEVACLIEYDGRQHFESISYWGGDKEFALSKKRDAIKRKYCSENNIPLIEIPYWERENITSILAKELDSLTGRMHLII